MSEIVYRFNLKGSKKTYITVYSPKQIRGLYAFDAHIEKGKLEGEREVILSKDVDFTSFEAIEFYEF